MLVEKTGNLPQQLDIARQALLQASDDFQRVKIRDVAKAVEAAAAILKHKDIQVDAANLVKEAEREIAKANPPQKRGPKTDNNFSLPEVEIIEEPAIDQKTVQNIRQAHSKVSDEQFEKLKQAAVEKGEPLTRKAVKESVKRPVTNPTGDTQWYTPLEIIDSVREVFGVIDLDPASCAKANEVVRAETFFTEADDGLSKDWYGKVFLNPPFNNTGAFVDKLIVFYQKGLVGEAILLVESLTQPSWFAKLMESADAHFLHTQDPSGRVYFWNADRTQRGKSRCYLFYFGIGIESFYRAFKDYGIVNVRYGGALC